MSASTDVAKWKHLPPPPGFAASVSSSKSSGKTVAAATASYEELKSKRAWDLAFSPAKSLPMQAFMLYMSGGGVQIFSMGIVFMLLSSPFKNLAGINTAFASFAPASSPPKALTTLSLQKLAYFFCNLLTLALGLWKCRSMGLLPTGTGDWLAFETRGQARTPISRYPYRFLMLPFVLKPPEILLI
ncbi:hypothetical protein GSI_07333 [Ganoderma sinense ZZ0214-1]|uniref:ER membrane protein complex subunit 4 n=1 Tax=Ganoderma sinense ZZ0214-1 TaxID=1077348 RepID=A0A2G8SA63_9APHY|nr:hypothetical protein GSI_07333 [Ganoderma sinense ZZ0214-1]